MNTNEKAELVYWILTNLEVNEESESDVDQAWCQVVHERVREIESGTVDLIPSSVMWKDLFLR